MTMPRTILTLLAPGPMPPEALRRKAREHGHPHNVVVSLERLREAGLVEVTARLTRKGRKALRSVAAQRD